MTDKGAVAVQWYSYIERIVHRLVYFHSCLSVQKIIIIRGNCKEVLHPSAMQPAE